MTASGSTNVKTSLIGPRNTLIGQWAKVTLGDAAADAKIAMLDLGVDQPTVDVLRDQGFLEGFGDLASQR